MKIVQNEKIKQYEFRKRESKAMKICNQKENLKRLKKILQLRKYLKQEQKQHSLAKSDKFLNTNLKKEFSTTKILASQATIQEDYSESLTSLISSQKKISFESDYNQIKPQIQLLNSKIFFNSTRSTQQSQNRVSSMSCDLFKQSSDSKCNQSSEFDQSMNQFEELEYNQLSNATKEPKSAKTPEKKSFVLFRYQKYHPNCYILFQIEIPPEYLKYIISASQEYQSIKKAYTKWISSTKQTDLKILSKEQQEKNKWIQVPDVLVRIPFDKVESNPQQHEEW